MQEENKHRGQEELLFHACQRGSLDDCKRLISQGIDINCKDRNGSTVLFHCCHPQQLKLVRFLLSNGLNPNLTNIRGNTPLHIAAERGYSEIILILLLHNADPYIYNVNGFRCDDLNPSVKPLIAWICKDKSAYGLLTDLQKKKLLQIFEDMDPDEKEFIDATNSFKFNRFIEDISEDVARRDALEFLKEVSICNPGQVNLEEWMFAFGKLTKDTGSEVAVDKFIEDFERGIKEKGKYADFKPRD